MHGSTSTFAATGFLAEEFTHHLTGWNTSTEGVDMVAIGAAEPVVLSFHRADYTRAHGFLAVVEVHKAKHFAPVIHLGALVFKASPQGHVPIELKSCFSINICPLGRNQVGEAF